jgi:hypothetical protein
MSMTLEQRIGHCPRYFIYGLYASNDDTCEIRYVGQTKQGRHRPYQHCHHRSLKKNWPIHSWIKNVISSDHQVRWEILEIVEKENLDSAEIRWIKDLKASGHRLTNLAVGGQSSHGCVPWNKGLKHCYNQTTLNSMSKAKKGKRWTEEHKKRFIQAIKEGKSSGRNKMGVSLSRPVTCVTDGKEFPSVIAAALHYGYPYHKVRREIKGRLGPRARPTVAHHFRFSNPNHTPSTGYFLKAVKIGPHGSMVSARNNR